MAIIDGIKQMKQFATGTNGDKQLISNWTSTSTVYDWDEIERKWVAVHDTLASDDKVAQIPTDNTRTYYELLFSESNDNLEHTEGTRKSQYLIYNPDIKRLKIGEEQTSSDISNTSITDHFIKTGTDTDYITLTQDDLTLTGDTWDGTHRSLKSTLETNKKYCLRIFFDNVTSVSARIVNINITEIATLFDDPSFDMENYYCSSVIIAPTSQDGETDIAKYDNRSDSVLVSATNSSELSDFLDVLNVEFSNAAFGGDYQYYNVYLIFEKMPTVHSYWEPA